MSLYHYLEWKEFRENIFESDGYRCTSCGKSKFEATLQVHHTKYLKGKLPWEYPTNLCETLCKGCHASRHGIIQPKIGWEYHGHEDLGDLIGTCENSGCGNTIRHVYLISHPEWGTLEVGTVCCDNLTDSSIASNNRENESRYSGRKKRFLNSKRWKFKNRALCIRQAHFEIEIRELRNYFQLTIHDLTSKKQYQSVEDAKLAAFDVIESGKLYEHLDKKGIRYRKKKQ